MDIDFYRDRNEGQLTPEERKALYTTILNEKPNVVFEVGTWKGGGSTYFISSGLYENKIGKLYTVECNKIFYDHAINLYNTTFSHLLPYVNFNYGESLIVYPEILEKISNIDFLFLDGGIVPEKTLAEYYMFMPYLKTGAILACHDWNEDNKMVKLRETILKDPSWKMIVYLPEGPTGFALFKKV